MSQDLARQINRWTWDRLPVECRMKLRKEYRRDRNGTWAAKAHPALVKDRLDARAHSEALRNGMAFAWDLGRNEQSPIESTESNRRSNP